MKDPRFLLYGANGYTGQLIARMANEYGLSPILAGRRREAVEPLAKELQYPFRVADLNDTDQLKNLLSEFRVVLNAAGPFQYTAHPMIEACMATGTNYLDITGEIPVFEMAKQYDQQAIAAGIIILPGVGFDVVPTDCLALFLRNKLPDANKLKLAFTTLNGSLSHGTATTMAENLGEKGAVRINGKIVRVPIGHKSMWVDFGYAKQLVMSIPWGDIATAYYSTGIPNIETYTGISPRVYQLLRFQKLFNWLLRTRLIRNSIRKKINKRGPGPSAEARSRGKSFVWGEVTNAEGQIARARLSGPEGYTLTAHSTLNILRKVLSGQVRPPGYHTPAELFGADLVLEIPGMNREPA